MTRTHTPEAADHRHRTRIVLSALTVALAALAGSLAPAGAQAAAWLGWSAAVTFDSGGTPSAVSCASESLCVAVDTRGQAFSTSDPTAAEPAWSKDEIDHGESLNAVSCAPGGPCVAVDGRGEAFVSVGPGAAEWRSSAVPDGGKALTGVSCPTSSLCVAVDGEGDIATTTTPESGGWTPASAHPLHELAAVSCSSQSLCVAVDKAGQELASDDPTGGASAWHPQTIDSTELLAVSCSAAGACVAVDAGGNALASADPVAPAPTWSATTIGGESLTAVSCASSGLCVAGDGGGAVHASDDPAAPIPAWSESGPDSKRFAGVSCLAGGFCMTVDASGRFLTGRVPAPGATTLKPTEVTDTSAALAGVVNPNDAVLGTCAFEYGTSVAYVQTIPCAVLPAALGGAQRVSAQMMGLAANTTYHYRVTASSPSGTTVGADEAFATAVNSLVAVVHPNPSISGTPANGQHLTCHPGTPSGTTAQLTYAWLRDLIPIPGAVSSMYTVKGQDTRHHLQCQVTATDGGGSATAKSAFVTIPVGGVPVSAGETAIGRAAFRNGKLIVPVSCSSQASGGCKVSLHLTVVETLSGGQIVAVAARADRARKSAGLRHRTVTLVSLRLRLGRGAHTTVAAAFGTTGRRLLARERHFTANLNVTGTIIGAIEGQLTQQLLTLSNGAHGAFTHVARRR
ncbi:MAG TPA: hypothetical protein VIJ66_07085 [Solirubrobacteraceae bacterium]